MASIEDMFLIVNQAIDLAFHQEKYNLNFYSYLQQENFKRDEINSFLQSTLSIAIKDQVDEIDLYLYGGPSASYIREAYGWMGKPRARKVRDYLNAIVDDAKKYETEKKPGRKSKKKAPSTANK